ncbi:hypothetical protein FA13DRAFT_1624645, partial [Coprinellus micaceus]
VFTLYMKTGGKNGKHTAVTDSSSIGAISSLGVQVFEHREGTSEFTSHPRATKLLGTCQFAFVFPFEFLLRIPWKSVAVQGCSSVLLDNLTFQRFLALKRESANLVLAVTLFKARGPKGGKGPDTEGDED